MGAGLAGIWLANVLRRGGSARSTYDIAVTGFPLGLAVGLKAFYSRAGFDDLRWVLDPAVKVAEWLGAGPFELEAHRGWLDRAHHFEVIPACAGVNFLIVVFLSLCLGPAPTLAALGGRLTFMAASAIVAYLATLLANAARLAIAVRLHSSVAFTGPIPAERVLDAVGTSVYFVVLLLVVAIASSVMAPRSALSRQGRLMT